MCVSRSPLHWTKGLKRIAVTGTSGSGSLTEVSGSGGRQQKKRSRFTLKKVVTRETWQ